MKRKPKKPYVVVVGAYNKNLDYIGDEKTAKYLYKKGIEPELADPKHKTCSIGYCKKEQKWYGWSHRAICGFGIGYTVKKEDTCISPKLGIKPGFKAKTLKDCKKLAKAFASNVS